MCARGVTYCVRRDVYACTKESPVCASQICRAVATDGRDSLVGTAMEPNDDIGVFEPFGHRKMHAQAFQ